MDCVDEVAFVNTVCQPTQGPAGGCAGTCSPGGPDDRDQWLQFIQHEEAGRGVRRKTRGGTSH